MMNTLTLIYFKLAELISTFIPSADGILNQFGMTLMDLSNVTDPGEVVTYLFEQILLLFAMAVILPLTLAYRLFMGLIGQPVPVPWF
tara:strand:- start:494 stop:754 length:261 start_codon:yes stop_codon:yes gene_type:complete